MIRVLFVCTGNICRSPTAEGIMRTRVAEAGLAGRIEADSAGTHAYHVGEAPDRRSVSAALKYGIHIGNLRARQVASEDFARFDVVAVMDAAHRQHLLGMCPKGFEGRVRLLMSFTEEEGALLDVPDPYYGDDGFDDVFRMIDRGVRGLLAHLRHREPALA